MLSERMQEALNGQVVAEVYSAFLYLSMSAYFSSHGLAGFARWMRVQRLEELTHAVRLYEYVIDAGGRVVLSPVDWSLPTDWDSELAVFEHALAHERKVTGLINDLVKVAGEEDDPPTKEFLTWYVDEQVEEEESAGGVVDKLKAAGGSADATGALDRELAAREFHPQDWGLAGGIG